MPCCPFRGVSTPYSVSAELYPGTLPGAYAGFGLTSSGSLQSNLPANGQIWIRLFQVAPFSGVDGRYEVRIGSQVLASGAVILDGFNPVSITVESAHGDGERLAQGRGSSAPGARGSRPASSRWKARDGLTISSFASFRSSAAIPSLGSVPDAPGRRPARAWVRVVRGQSRPGGRRRRQTAREESPGSTGQGAG